MTRQLPKRRNRRWPGVKAAAIELGVSYEHLFMCIKGISHSNKLMGRYAALKAEQTKEQDGPK